MSAEDPAAERLFAFFERLKTMSSIQRFGTLPMIQGENVASHSFNVAILALLTADYENNPAINTEKVLRQALLHDFEETILSDIPHPIKHRFQGGKLGKVLKDIVPDLVRDEIFKELPQPLRDRCTHAALTAKDGIEGRIVAAADAMDLDRLRVIDTGLDPVTAEREQWDDGNNPLALAPGVVVAYERNTETNARLTDAGIEVLPIAASELGTGRGGPRCMSCPAARDPL